MENREHLGGQEVWMALLDAGCLVTGILLSIVLRFDSGALGEYFIERIYGWFYYAGSIILANYLIGSYGIQIKISRFNLVVNWAFSVCVALLVVSITSYAWLQTVLGRGVLGIAIALYSLLWLLVNLFVYNVILRLPAFAYRVAILGTGPGAQELIGLVSSDQIRPIHRVVALVWLMRDKEAEVPLAGPTGIPLLACVPEELAATVARLEARALILCPDSQADLAAVYPQLRRLRFEGVSVRDALSVAETYRGRIQLDQVNEQWLMQASAGLASPLDMHFKRILDIILAGLGLILLGPLALIEALLIKIAAPRQPVFYCQARMGRFGRPFVILKFRTMRPGTADEAAAWSPPADRRVTPLGRVLRRYRLDEIPQLINVLKGDMSMVGPRPEQPQLVSELEKAIPFYRERENVMPGLTGWAQICYPYGATTEDARRKLEYDLYYIKNLSLAFDLRILLNTLRIVILGMERRMI